MILSTIDIGTNTVLLLITEQTDSGFKVLRDEARITRLGQGLHESPFFQTESRERTLKVLNEYAELSKELGSEKIMAIGTAAFRKANNASEFVEQVKEKTGISIQIISGDDEARLAYLSAQHDFSDQYENIFVLDIGGGSTEIISQVGGRSFDVGAVILTESIIHHDPITENEFQKLKIKISDSFSRWGFGPLQAEGFSPEFSVKRPVLPARTVIGLAGTVTTLSAIQQKLASWDGNKVQGSRLKKNDVSQMVDLFRKTSIQEKSKIVGMVKGREDTILAGSMILEAVMEALQVEEVIVSDRGLRYGLLYMVD